MISQVVEDHSSLLGRPVKEIARHIADNYGHVPLLWAE